MVDSNETPNNTPSPNSQVNHNVADKHNALIKGIHDRVLTYVLLKIEKQIERLIDLDGGLDVFDSSISNDSTTSYDQTPSSSVPCDQTTAVNMRVDPQKDSTNHVDSHNIIQSNFQNDLMNKTIGSSHNTDATALM